MFNFLEKFRRVAPALYGLQLQYRKQQRFNNSFLQRYRHYPDNDGSLTKKDLRRMNDYPLQFIVFFADFFSILRGKALSGVERERLSSYAALCCLYDDFFDEKTLEKEEIWQLYKHPTDFSSKNTKERVCRELFLRLYSIYSPDETFDNLFRKFYEAQIASLHQYQGHHLEREKIKEISFNKGGNALAISRLLLDNLPIKDEIEAVYELGAWFQILDDIVDIAKDRREDIATLITTATKVEQVEQDLKEQTEIAFSALNALAYPRKNIFKTLHRFFVIGTTGWVHLGNLQKLQGKGSFELASYTEKDIQWVESKLSNYVNGIYLMIKRKI